MPDGPFPRQDRPDAPAPASGDATPPDTPGRDAAGAPDPGATRPASPDGAHAARAATAPVPRDPPAPPGTPPSPPRGTPARTLRDADALRDAGLIDPEARAAIAAVAERYAIAVTPAVAALIDRDDPADPIARQFVPDPAELRTTPQELADPIADGPHTPVPGVVHRYPDRALLKPLLACPVYCRFCFRREVVGPDGGVLAEPALEAALDWFRRTPQVREAILTGGDPLMLSPRRLGHIVAALSAMPHIEIIRIHSRVPVADPARITPALLDALDTDKALFLCVHANHAREFSADARTALRRLARGGVALLGQSVLLRGVNDSAAALEALFRAMLASRVKPYYLHQLDRAPGTARFEVPIAEGRALLRALRGRVTGLAWPTYVLDLPGGEGKAPLGPEFAARDGAGWVVEGPLGGAWRQEDAPG
ncbi:lysine-2,3-aminomutase-like protein [Roseomonas sp. NAR14]|uniref:Lysine-2,3-aminomutase-like protein n=1 Tax=Roseomonas acroporae TaxID=2937791 RepID=A0A9X1Y8G8_9PROT|nr:lysine-2,3-aminomutase-like protein [Roseomonas acroporae]MCK8785421.1 lysine-2,3-aminomutase-like protein [Roseomonas acroporae]